ncbi:MAG: flagellar basal-body rod protein FlgF [Firmicutes bacterium]|jgi:flagellar basal-body rod protein FlgF|nr:flagellar basal-body rod protein FlgF [Bacillota bacterium]
MLRGLYTAASGMLVQTARMDMLSNNLANVDTAGFQRQAPHIYAFPEMLISRVHNGTSVPIGRLGTGAAVNGDRSSFLPGALRSTGNPLDAALVGPGFFAVETPEGPRYTRDGRFTTNASGWLVTLDGHRVRGERGPILINGTDVVIDGTGQVLVDGRFVDKLLVVEFTDRDGLLRRGANLYEATPEAGPPFRYRDTTVVQGAVEMANVNVIREMVNLISVQRAYEANAKVVQAYDETLGKAVNEI